MCSPFLYFVLKEFQFCQKIMIRSTKTRKSSPGRYYHLVKSFSKHLRVKESERRSAKVLPTSSQNDLIVIQQVTWKGSNEDRWEESMKIRANQESVKITQFRLRLAEVSESVPSHSDMMQASIPNKSIEIESKGKAKHRVRSFVMMPNCVEVHKQNPSAMFFHS